jgi:hypothetical protein
MPHPPQQVRQQPGPGIIGYRGSSDCRILIVSHKPIMIAAAAPLRGHPSDLHQQPHGHELLLPQECVSEEQAPTDRAGEDPGGVRINTASIQMSHFLDR